MTVENFGKCTTEGYTYDEWLSKDRWPSSLVTAIEYLTGCDRVRFPDHQELIAENVFASHPYGLRSSDLKALAKLEEYGIKVDVSGESRYYPGCTLRVELRIRSWEWLMDCLVVKALMRIHDNYERCGVPWRPSLMTVAREVYKAGFYSELDEWGVDRKLMESFDRECPTNCRCELRVNGKPVTNDDVDSLPWCDIRDMKPLVLAFRHWEGNSGVFRDVIIGVHRDTGELVCTPRLDPDPEWYWRLPFLTVTAKMFPFYGDVVI